jgi:hypothetical protein
MWLAGGGVKGAVSVGAADELGSAAVQDRFHVKHLHTTILRQLGLGPNRLSFFYNGLDQRLVGVEGAEPIRQVIAEAGRIGVVRPRRNSQSTRQSSTLGPGYFVFSP